MAELMVNAFRVDGFAEHEVRIFNRPLGTHRFVVTKHPLDVVNVRPMLWRWPWLWVICMVRDPRDVVVSRHGRVPDTYYVGLNEWKERYPAARRLRSHPRVTLVRYEDLVSDPDAVQMHLMRWMPSLEKVAAFSEYHLRAKPSEKSSLALGGVRPVSAASVGRWREHKSRLVTQMQRHGSIARDLVELGYEADGSWLGELAGVEPDGSGSFRPETMPGLDRWSWRWWQLRNTVRCFVGLERPISLTRPGEGTSARADRPY
jgi:hypothetical protein